MHGTLKIKLTRKEAYVGVRQSSSDNDPSIPTTENEAHTSVTADTRLKVSSYITVMVFSKEHLDLYLITKQFFVL